MSFTCVLQCLQCVAECVAKCVAACCSVLQCLVVYRHHVDTNRYRLPMNCGVLQCVAV